MEVTTPNSADTVALDPVEAVVMAEYRQAARDIEQQSLGALRLIYRQRGLQGDWTLDGDKLVRKNGLAQ